MDILRYNKTQTTQFIIPLLFRDKQFNELITDFDSLINAYIADFDKPKYDNKVIIAFRDKQKNLPEENRIEHYTKTIKDEIIHFYVYSLPKEFEEDYTLFLLGKYSSFTESAKQKILNFWNSNEDSLLYGALYKTGETIKKFYKENFDTKIDDTWSNGESEWWPEPILRKEIYGAE